MDPAALVEADRLVASLSPGRREAVREIVHDAARRRTVSTSARRYLDAATGSALVADVLESAIAEAAGSSGRTLHPSIAVAEPQRSSSATTSRNLSDGHPD